MLSIFYVLIGHLYIFGETAFKSFAQFFLNQILFVWVF